MARRRLRRGTIACALALAVLGLAVPARAWAYLTSSGQAVVSAGVGSVDAPGAITTQQTGQDIAIGWSAAALSSGGSVAGYTVRRSDGTTVCGSPTPVTGTSCTDSSGDVGSFTYTVSAVYHSFTASASSGSVAVLTAPTLDSTPSSVSAGRSPSVSFGGGGGTGYECRLDGAAFTTCSSPWSPGTLGDGDHTVEVEAVNGSSSGPATTYAWTVDGAAPSITAAPADPSRSASASFAFASAESSYTYSCRLDGASFSPCTSPLADTGLTDGRHTFEVVAVSPDGARSAVASTSWLVDTTPPGSAVTFPATGTSEDDASFTAGCDVAPFQAPGAICGTATDSGSGVQAVRVSIEQGSGDYWDGSGFTSASEHLLTADGTTAWSLAFDPSNFPADGSYTVRAYAVDAAGNVQPTAAETTFTIDTTPPVVSVATLNGSPTGFPDDADQSITTIGGGCGTAGGDLSTVSWSVAGAATQSGSAPCASGAWSATLATPLAAGAYTLSATQSDAAGNTGDSGADALTVDMTPPTSSITFPVSGGAYTTTGTDTWQAGCSGLICGTASDSGGSGVQSVLVSIENASGAYWNGSSFSAATVDALTATGTTSWSYALAGTALPEGTYTVTVSALDGAGNLQTSADTSTFTIDNTPPSIAISQVNGRSFSSPGSELSITDDGGTCGTATGDDPTVSWAAVNGSGTTVQSGTTTCSGGTWTASFSPTIGTPGTYRLTASQGDWAGNTGTASASVSVI